MTRAEQFAGIGIKSCMVLAVENLGLPVLPLDRLGYGTLTRLLGEIKRTVSVVCGDGQTITGYIVWRLNEVDLTRRLSDVFAWLTLKQATKWQGEKTPSSAKMPEDSMGCVLMVADCVRRFWQMRRVHVTHFVRVAGPPRIYTDDKGKVLTVEAVSVTMDFLWTWLPDLAEVIYSKREHVIESTYLYERQELRESMVLVNLAYWPFVLTVIRREICAIDAIYARGTNFNHVSAANASCASTRNC
eukprot:COSAG01_NODE_2326_length_7903_cov_22.624552_9_plen_244_part_00